MGHTAISGPALSGGPSTRDYPVIPARLPSPAVGAVPTHTTAMTIEAAYALWSGRCFGIAMAVTSSRQLAEEAVQDAFCTWWRQQDRYDPARSSLGAWLVLLTHHRAVDAVRRERRQHRIATAHARDRAIQPQPHHPIDMQVISADQGARVRAALTILTPPQREVLLLAYFGGRTQSEIAAQLDIPLGTVKTRSHSALRRLRDHLDDHAANGPNA